MKNHIIEILVISVCVVQVLSQAATYTKVVLDDPSALCLDGSPGAYYVLPGTQSKKFVLYFEGGGWCGASTLANTIQSCYQRSKTDLGSSKAYPNTFSFGAGIMSNANENNFKNMTRVYLKYCDGSGHQGTRKEPLSYKDAKLYFRGSNVTLAQFASLEQKYGLYSKSELVIVSGGSAGGLASFLWTQHVTKNAKSAKVYGVPDSGIFLDEINFKTNQRTYRLQFQNLFKISNLQIDPPTPECVKKYPNSKHLCMFAENIYQQITSPLFLVQSLYDSWSIPNIIGISCLSSNTLNNCSNQQKMQIEQYHRNLTNLIFSMTSNSRNGCWAPICINHVYMLSTAFYNSQYRIPMNSNNSIEKTLWQWINGEEVYYRHIDDGQWPANKPCSGVNNHNSILKGIKKQNIYLRSSLK